MFSASHCYRSFDIIMYEVCCFCLGLDPMRVTSPGESLLCGLWVCRSWTGVLVQKSSITYFFPSSFLLSGRLTIRSRGTLRSFSRAFHFDYFNDRFFNEEEQNLMSFWMLTTWLQMNNITVRRSITMALIQYFRNLGCLQFGLFDWLGQCI